MAPIVAPFLALRQPLPTMPSCPNAKPCRAVARPDRKPGPASR